MGVWVIIRAPFSFMGVIIISRKRLKLSTPTEVRRAVSRVANMVLNNELDPKQANAIMYACNVLLSSIRTDEQEKRLAELENIINERKI